MITIEEIAPRLPYRLQMYKEKSGNIRTVCGIKSCGDGDLLFYFTDGNKHYQSAFNYKLVARPLSDLTRPITVDGETFVPIEYLKEKFTGGGDGQELRFYEDGQYFYSYRNGCHCICAQGEMIQKLISWRFWLGDQDRFGKDIIDINTISNASE